MTLESSINFIICLVPSSRKDFVLKLHDRLPNDYEQILGKDKN